MIIPVKCFTCGNVLANKYRFYLQEVTKEKNVKGIQNEAIQYLSDEEY